MKKTRNGKRRNSREFKVAALPRVIEGEALVEVARDLEIPIPVLWNWRKRVIEKGEDELHDWGRPKGSQTSVEATGAGQQRRIAELERLVGRQQMEIRFLDRALCRVEELRQPKNDDGAAASTKR